MAFGKKAISPNAIFGLFPQKSYQKRQTIRCPSVTASYHFFVFWEPNRQLIHCFSGYCCWCCSYTNKLNQIPFLFPFKEVFNIFI
jgi:hypothetical protein